LLQYQLNNDCDEKKVEIKKKNHSGQGIYGQGSLAADISPSLFVIGFNLRVCIKY